MRLRTPVLVTILVAAPALLAVSSTEPPAVEARTPSPPQAAGDPARSQVARGEYLVRIMACNDCHTPWTLGPNGPEPDMSRQLSGHPEGVAVAGPPAPLAEPWAWAGAGTNTAFAGPWGVSFTANLTPDPETGLGKWDAETFVRTIRTGRHEGRGRPILPPMPWPMYRNATDEDLHAVFAYLRSLPPIRNQVPQPIEPPDGE